MQRFNIKIHQVCLLFIMLSALAAVSCTPSRDFLLKRSARAGIDNRYVRILVAQTGERVLISSESRMKIMEIAARRILYDGKGKKFYFYPEKVTRPVALESWNSPLCVNGKCYRGTIEIHNSLGRIQVINVLKIEEYLYGVVPCEISSGWGSEALKAQAVAARTYAYHHLINKKDIPFDLDATSNFQVYGGLSAETVPTRNAVNDTSGEIAMAADKPIEAYFHSTCGGTTTDVRWVWSGGNLDYLRSVKCDYCRESPYYSWQESISLYDIRHFLSKKYKGIGIVTGLSLKKKGGRVSSVIIAHRNGTLKLSGNDFRMLFPDKKLKSLYFEAVKTQNGLVLHGHGWGHGVGLCQWGAKAMASKGSRYKEILKYYYKGISLMNINSGLAGRRKKPENLSPVRYPASRTGKV